MNQLSRQEDNTGKLVQTLDRTTNQLPLTEANGEANDLFSNVDYNLSSVDNQSVQQTNPMPAVHQTIESLSEQVLQTPIVVDSSRPFPCLVCGVGVQEVITS